MNRRARFYVVTVCVIASASVAFAGPQFKKFDQQGCNGRGIRQWASTLENAKDWIPDCQRTAADVSGVHFDRPSRCKKDTFHVWGEFDVPDQSCGPHFDRFDRQDCDSNGIRQYASTLQNATNWIPDCQTTPATVAGKAFSAPSRCKKDITHVWGEFDVPDSSCNTTWSKFDKQACVRDGVRQYASTLQSSHNWIPDCQSTPANVAGKNFSTPSRCKKDAFHVWGEFDVEDSSCKPYWGSFERQQCSYLDQRQFASTLQQAFNWIPDCQATPADVTGNHFDRPSRCNQDVTHVWGEFDVADKGCEPSFSQLSLGACNGGTRTYVSPFINIPSREDPANLCRRWWTMINNRKYSPVSCATIGGVTGTFEAPDPSCTAKPTTPTTSTTAGSGACSGFASITFENTPKTEVVIWLYDETIFANTNDVASSLIDENHLLPGKTKEYKFPKVGDTYDLIAIDLSAVQQHNTSFPQDVVDADSKDPEIGAVYAPQYFATTIGATVACASGGSLLASSPARQSVGPFTGPKRPSTH